MSQHNKECCNKVEELEVENFVATKENYVTTEDEEERTKQKTISIMYFMLQHFNLMSQHRARLKDKKFCRDKEIYIVIEFKSSRT